MPGDHQPVANASEIAIEAVYSDLFPQQIAWEDGFAWCPDSPGLGVGVDLDMDAAERSVIDLPQWWPPRLRREDGSITNW